MCKEASSSTVAVMYSIWTYFLIYSGLALQASATSTSLPNDSEYCWYKERTYFQALKFPLFIPVHNTAFRILGLRLKY